MNTGRCRRRPARLAAATATAFALLLALAGCGGGAGSRAAERGATGTLSAQALLGTQIFEDVWLSASGRQACISGHDASPRPRQPTAATRCLPIAATTTWACRATRRWPRTLKDALTFYVQRDTDLEKGCPREVDGVLRKFDDLPAALHGNVNTGEALYKRRPGDLPALSDAEIDDLIAFLGTLSDGYTR